MKRAGIALLLILTLFLPGLRASAQTAASATLQGLITEVGDGFFLMDDNTVGSVRVNLDDHLTVYEGTAARDALAADQYVYVTYDGVMTRSLPPQVTALKVSCFSIRGTVGAILDGGYTVEGDAVLGTVIVHMGEGFPPVFRGVPVTVYYNGVMALSMPPQISAVHIAVPSLTGTVSDMTDRGFTLAPKDGGVQTVSLTAETAMQFLPADGDMVTVYYSGTAAADGSVTALSVASGPTGAEADTALE